MRKQQHKFLQIACTPQNELQAFGSMGHGQLPRSMLVFRPKNNGASQGTPILKDFCDKSRGNTAEKSVLPGIREEKEVKPTLNNFSQAVQIPLYAN